MDQSKLARVLTLVSWFFLALLLLAAVWAGGISVHYWGGIGV
jgi:hypothetical protein